MKSYIEIGNANVEKTNREFKGKSFIDFPSNYCIIDIETTGLCPEWDSIIEIGAIKYNKNIEIGRFQSLVQPEETYDDGTFIDDFIVDLTGITNEMLKNAPKNKEVIKSFSKFLGDDIIVGYNVSFDVNFLYDNFLKILNTPMTNPYIDVMRMARKLYPSMKHHRLKDMVQMYDINHRNKHRAIGDCEATSICYDNLLKEAISQFGVVDNFIAAFKKVGHFIKAADIHTDKETFNEDSPLFNQVCVFTGKL